MAIYAYLTWYCKEVVCMFVAHTHIVYCRERGRERVGGGERGGGRGRERVILINAEQFVSLSLSLSLVPRMPMSRSCSCLATSGYISSPEEKSTTTTLTWTLYLSPERGAERERQWNEDIECEYCSTHELTINGKHNHTHSLHVLTFLNIDIT